MSIQTLSESLQSFISNKKNFKLTNIPKTKNHLKRLSFLLSNASLSVSLSFTKQIALICNHNYEKDDGSRLALAEDIILSYLKSAKNSSVAPPESLINILIITHLNQSFVYQVIKPNKSIESVIKAIKIPEQFPLKSRKGKLIKFNAQLRLCQLYIHLQKFTCCIAAAQQVLSGVLKKLHKRNKKLFKQFVMVAVTAFYRIGICEQALSLSKSAEVALENANWLIEKYLPNKSKILELDFEMISHRSFFKTLPEQKSRKKEEKSDLKAATDRVFLTTPVLEIKSPAKFESVKVESEQTSFKLPGRYYTKSRLQRLNGMLEEKEVFNYNTDSYFFKKLSKTLAVPGDLKATALNIKQDVNEQIHDVWVNKEILKKRRGFTHQEIVPSSRFKIQDQIEDLQDDFETKLKLQAGKMKSKLKTKVYKKLLRSINVPVKSCKTYPAQRLFFKPPEARLKKEMSTIGKTANGQDRAKKYEDVKLEIEDQMEALKREIEGFSSNRVWEFKPACLLATSTYGKNPRRGVKESISKCFKAKNK